MHRWMQAIGNSSLREGVGPPALKETVMCPLLKGPLLVLDRDYLDPFQSGFRPGFGTVIALIVLMDDLW